MPDGSGELFSIGGIGKMMIPILHMYDRDERNLALVQVPTMVPFSKVIELTVFPPALIPLI